MSTLKKMVDSFGRSPEENRDRQELKDRANAEAKEHWENPTWRREFAAALTESILLGFEYDTLIDRMVDTERLGFDDRSLVRETNGLKAYYMARGGYIEASQLSTDITELPRDMIGVHVSEFEDKFLTNFADSAQALRDLSIRRMDAEVNRRVVSVLNAAIPSGAYYSSAAGITEATLKGFISAVRDETNGSDVTIFGRSTMVDQLLDFDTFNDEIRGEINDKGVLGKYRGATVVTLTNYKDEDGNSYIPANEMWVVAKDFGKFAFYGGLKSKEFTEQDNWYWHYLARRDTGMLVHHPERARRIVDTSITA